METIINNLDNILLIVGAIIGAFATIATITPNKSDDRIAQFLLDAVNMLGMNVGKARNGTDRTE